jgi:hypothetical protein
MRGLRSVDALLEGRAAIRRQRKAFILSIPSQLLLFRPRVFVVVRKAMRTFNLACPSPAPQRQEIHKNVPVFENRSQLQHCRNATITPSHVN